MKYNECDRKHNCDKEKVLSSNNAINYDTISLLVTKGARPSDSNFTPGLQSGYGRFSVPLRCLRNLVSTTLPVVCINKKVHLSPPNY